MIEMPPGLNVTQQRVWQAALTIQDGDPARPVSCQEIARVARLYPVGVYSALKRMDRQGTPFPFPMPKGGRYPGPNRKNIEIQDEPEDPPLLSPCSRPTSEEVERRACEERRRAVRRYLREWKVIRKANGWRSAS